MTKKKLGNFQVIKLSSKRLKNENFKINIGYRDAIRNNEIINLGQNSLCESIQRILSKPIDFNRFEELELKKKQISKRKNSNINREFLAEINQEIQGLTFIPELIAIAFDDKRHYVNIISDGLYIGGQEFVRILASSGNIRNNTIFFVEKSISRELKELLNAGRNESLELTPSKLTAYLGLHGTASHPVSFPSFAVISDYEFERLADVSWIHEDSSVETLSRYVKINCFDGQGLISPELALRWANELGSDHTPSTIILRAPFVKGQVATMDFHALAKELDVADGIDIWGNSFNIFEKDLILSASQFKMGKDSYESSKDYGIEIQKRGFGFRVSRIAPRESRMDVTSNYMFLQILEMGDDAIGELIGDTVRYFDDIEIQDVLKTSLYLSGSNAFQQDFDSEKFQDLDMLTKAVLSYPPLLKEKYISQRIKSVIRKKETQAKLGKLVLKGNYSPLVADIYAQAEWLCGEKEPKGMLEEHESYSYFWNSESVDIVACCRSPLTHSSEMMKHNLVETAKMNRWFEFQQTSYIFNIHGLDSMRAADADKDGDILFSTNSKTLMNCGVSGNPITYTTGSSEKIFVTEKAMQQVDINGMGSRIGHITNLSSFYNNFKYEFEDSSEEKVEIDRRLKIFRRLQGSAIDAVKYGAESVIIPKNWLKYDTDLSDMDKKLLADRRPYFMRYNYPRYNKKYKDERDKYNKLSWSHFGRSFQEILDSVIRTEEEQAAVDNYFKYSFFIFTPSPMNKVSWMMEKEINEIHHSIKSKGFDYQKLFSNASFKPNNETMKKIRDLYIQYRGVKIAWKKAQNKSEKKDIHQIISKIRKDAEEKISSNSEDIANHAVQLMANDSKTRGFAWDVFGDGIIEGLLDRYGHQIDVLVQDYYGKEEFLYKKYSKKKVFV